MSDVCWWTGHGFTAEGSARWILDAGLWIIDVGPLVLLQILVLR